MNDLDDQARALIELARDGDDPTAEDRARVQRRLATAIATGGAGALGAKMAAAKALSSVAGTTSGAGLGALGTKTALSSPAIAKSAGAGLVFGGGLTTTKIAAVLLSGLVAGGLAAGAAVVAVDDDAAPQRPRSQTNATERPAGPETTPRRSASRRLDEVGPAQKTAAISNAKAAGEQPTDGPKHETAEPARAMAAPARHRSALVETSAASIAEETKLLEAARAALGAGDGAGALAHVSGHASRFPSGVLTEEAAAVRVLALCQLGRVGEAKRAAAAFARAFPASPQRARLSASCAGAAKIP